MTQALFMFYHNQLECSHRLTNKMRQLFVTHHNVTPPPHWLSYQIFPLRKYRDLQSFQLFQRSGNDQLRRSLI